MNEIVKVVSDQPIQVPQELFSAPKNMPLGTARFGGQSDLLVFQENAGMTYICGGDTPNILPLGVLDDQHILVLGNTRGGKGTSVLINNTCLASGSIFVVDPKAENASVTARRRADGSAWCHGMKQKTHLVDPFNVAGRKTGLIGRGNRGRESIRQTDHDSLDDLRARYNPLDSIDLESEIAIDQVSAIADALIPVENEKDPYWERAARSLIKSVILHVLTSDEFDEDDRNLATVYLLLNTGDRDKKAFLEEIGADQIDTAHVLLFSSMETNPAFNGQIAATGEKYCMMAKEAAKQFLGVIETVNMKLEFIESPGMQRTLANRSEFTGGCLVCLCD